MRVVPTKQKRQTFQPAVFRMVKFFLVVPQIVLKGKLLVFDTVAFQ